MGRKGVRFYFGPFGARHRRAESPPLFATKGLNKNELWDHFFFLFRAPPSTHMTPSPLFRTHQITTKKNNVLENDFAWPLLSYPRCDFPFIVKALRIHPFGQLVTFLPIMTSRNKMTTSLFNLIGCEHFLGSCRCNFASAIINILREKCSNTSNVINRTWFLLLFYDRNILRE